jgi:hypothetical protein
MPATCCCAGARSPPIAVAVLLVLRAWVNLTALAVFGGAVGVGLGFGLQSIASNFISGIIILRNRSVSVDDYIELEDGRTGIVRELNGRSTTLETFDGKDVMVPNEKFLVETFANWTHRTSNSATGSILRSAATSCRSTSSRTARLPASAIPASTCSSSSGWRGSTTGETASRHCST